LWYFIESLLCFLFYYYGFIKDEWQKTHKQKEKKLQDSIAIQEKKSLDLISKELELSNEDQKFKSIAGELAERYFIFHIIFYLHYILFSN
jgi:hypothetical protein